MRIAHLSTTDRPARTCRWKELISAWPLSPTTTRPGSTRAPTSPAVDKLNLDIQDGEFLVLVGPSGCGKTTSLRMLAGLEDVNDGRILIGDRDVTHEAPKDRDIAMVFQNYALYPHMTVADNMGFALKIAGTPKADIRKRVEEAAKILDLEAVPRPQAEGALRWPAPARRHGPRDRAPAAGLPDGRAAVEPRRQAARADPHPDRVAAAPARHHHRLRHPRPGRGHDDGRPGRRAQGRPAAAGRHPAAHVRPPEQRLRGRLHRLARDEPASTPPVTDGGVKFGSGTYPVAREHLDGQPARRSRSACDPRTSR